MKRSIFIIATLLLATIALSQNTEYGNDDFKITNVEVTYHTNLDVLIWEITVAGNAGATTPSPAGKMNGAPVLGYVFPTTLKSSDVGFSETDGIVALALTSHPDFDDTPLWDENMDSKYDNDGVIWHPHWVVLVEDKRVEGGLAVKQFKKDDSTVKLPPTNPGMPMYMDSPGYGVKAINNTIKVVVPKYRMNNQISFNYDGVAAYMQVNTENLDKPMLGVYKVYSVASGNLTLPYTVKSN
ncbi:hypothetical protein LS48_00585 [Aequorivita aquimaris]|uniref:Uncharacterized protein n=1 Tax=Aequorivita aquimaris TaxID=1548749 RepID=A0A137RLE3_9FLAO|nr:hypothetical protein [Aequorivita aquimaris]KXO01012.1 hypothetical protein LS48_00585 [Aequorivita aquimaris]